MNSVSRNQPCPCGSGQRFKHCCGRGGATGPEDTSAASTELAAIAPMAGSGAPLLSIVLPYYRKLAEFRRVLPLNLPYFSRAGIEVILVLDESSEEAELLALIAEHRGVRWKVFVNDVPHPWRPPCKAINIGLRHAAGQYVLIASPESAFVGDVPAHALQVVSDRSRGIAIGRVGFARFDQLREGRSLEQLFNERVPPRFLLHTFYGSICGPKSAFEIVGGYDETFAEWGGDDDNIRVRLEMAGHTLLACPGLRLVHLSIEPRDGGQHFDPDDDFRKCTPQDAVANPNVDWGRVFSRVAYVAGIPEVAVGAGPGPTAARLALPQGAVIPTGSRRRCDVCGRLLHYEPRAFACAGCQPVAHVVAHGGVKAPRPRIGCVLQLRNEQRYLEGCLAHVGPYVDGIVALDDGSTDATADILERDPKVLSNLSNPPRESHVWREQENKRRLLERARELGFDWVLCCDADERYEILFLENLHRIASSLPGDELTCVSLTYRELWDAPDQYRSDGIWGKKTRARFFRIPKSIAFDMDQDLHGQWYPDEVRHRGRMLRTYHLLFHLKMIRREDRMARRDLYKRLDPDHRAQDMGYDYLAEEGAALRLEKIRPSRGYDYATLPAELRSRSPDFGRQQR